MYVRIGAKIKKAREERHLSQADLGIKLGVTATAINYYEKGKRKINIDDLYRLAIALEKPIDYFLLDEDEKGSGSKQIHERKVKAFYDLISMPVLGTIPAGEPVFSEQNVIGHLPFPRNLVGEVNFALRVKGDSMVGEGICEGDLVLIRRQSFVDYNGQIICALVNGEENTLKIFLEEKGEIRLRAANPAYPDIILDNERDLTVQGVYVGVFKFSTGQK